MEISALIERTFSIAGQTRSSEALENNFREKRITPMGKWLRINTFCESRSVRLDRYQTIGRRLY